MEEAEVRCDAVKVVINKVDLLPSTSVICCVCLLFVCLRVSFRSHIQHNVHVFCVCD